jgi:hypothetical protein
VKDQQGTVNIRTMFLGHLLADAAPLTTFRLLMWVLTVRQHISC